MSWRGPTLAVAVLVALAAAPAAVAAQQARPGISAHRGGAMYAPENTMVAFRNAVRLGADVLEMDAQLTADDVVVLIHDDTLDRTTDCTGAVNAVTYDEMLACDAAHWFSPGQPTTQVDEGAPHPLRGTGVTVPTAEEVFAYVATLGAGAPEISIEIKDIPGEANFDPAGTAVAAELVPLIQASGIADRIHVQSFWPPAIEAVKSIDPSIRTLFLTTPQTGTLATENLAYVVSRGHDISAPAWTTPDAGPGLVAAAHAAGKQFVPWTVDQRADLESVATWGTDAIITNAPACLADVLGRDRPADVRPSELVAAGGAAIAACPGEAAPSVERPAGEQRPVEDRAGQLPDTGGTPSTLAVLLLGGAGAAASRIGVGRGGPQRTRATGRRARRRASATSAASAVGTLVTSSETPNSP